MIYDFQGMKPNIEKDVFIADSSDIIGDVTIMQDCSIWFGTVIRGDDNSVTIKRGTNIQDNCTVHINSEKYSTNIGEFVTIGHGSIIHACSIGDYVLVGMGSIVLDGAEIGDYTIIGAGSLVTKGTKVPSGVLCLGSPAKVIRELTDEEKKGLIDSANHYIGLSKKYL